MGHLKNLSFWFVRRKLKDFFLMKEGVLQFPTDKPKTQVRKFLIAAGGTGGHLFPAQQLAEILKEDAEILFAGHKITTSPFFDRTKIPFCEIDAHPLKKGFLKSAWRGFWQAWRCIRNFDPDAIIGFGSYHTFPVLLAGAILRKKLILFEANSVLGQVNRLFTPAALRIAVQFPLRLKKGIQVPWLPWKSKEHKMSLTNARTMYGLDPNVKTILVFGGSQGASFLNELAPQALSQLKGAFQVIHLSGPSQEETVRLAYARWKIRACVKAFEQEMAAAYTAANLALCRSGAGTIAELIRFAIPALLIPYPFATEDHQKKNGEFLVDEVKAARLLIQKEATAARIAFEMDQLFVEANEMVQRLRATDAMSRSRPQLNQIIKDLV